MKPLATTLGESQVLRARSANRECAQLYLVVECDRPLAGGARYSLEGIRSISVGRGAQRTVTRDGTNLIVAAPDDWMSREHARIDKAMGNWVLRDQGARNGTRINGSKTERAAIKDGDVLEIGHTLFLFREHVEIFPSTEQDVDSSDGVPAYPCFATLEPHVQDEFERLEKVAAANLDVLILGESGTGKELAARALHYFSRKSEPFVAMNCGAIATNLVESELFGHKRGAFSGADQDRPGYVRSADMGTLFLDEIGDLPLSSQVAFLRVLQEREVVPVGGTSPVPVDIRLVSATHRDLDAAVEEERFRGDLLARISGYTVDLPALRDRRADLGVLMAALLPIITPGQAERLTISCAAVRTMLAYHWPRNIRELEKCLAVGVALTDSVRIDVDHLPEAVRRREPNAVAKAVAELTPHDQERKQSLVARLQQANGNVSAVAREMGKARSQVQRWLVRYGINAESYRE